MEKIEKPMVRPITEIVEAYDHCNSSGVIEPLKFPPFPLHSLAQGEEEKKRCLRHRKSDAVQ